MINHVEFSRRHEPMIKKPSFSGVFDLLLLIVVNAGLVASLLACFSLHNEYCELLSHFKFHYFILSVVFLVVMLLKRKRALSCIALAWFTFNALPVLPYYLPVDKSISGTSSKLKLMQLNLLLDNQAHEQVVRLIQKERPDIISLEEVRAHWVQGLKPIEKDYPYRFIQPDIFAFGIALYSKYPLTQTHIEYFGSANAYSPTSFPSISAQIILDHQPISLLVTHPVPPTLFDLRNRQLASMTQARHQFGENLIVLGDLNSSQWSPFFQNLIHRMGLRDSQLGFGVQPSWQSENWLLRVPIDHILTSSNIVILNRYIGPLVGSDHLPVFAEIALKPATEPK
jgi:endonuclease/exonuclease/phosphatase (EEP) superfamily protein YafD